MTSCGSFSALLLVWLWNAVLTAAHKDDEKMASLVQSRENTKFFVNEFLWDGDTKRAEFFSDEVWNGNEPYFVKASFRDTDLLWTLKRSEYYIRKDPRDWIYKDEMQIVKDGQHVLYPSELASWRQIQTYLGQGYTIVLNDLNKRHPPIRHLCAELEEQLGAFVQANVYWTPGGSTGFDPHYDWHDIIVLQLEGTKTWTICEQRPVDLYADRKDKGRGIYRHGDNLGNCTNYNFEPGDVFYAPPGTIHYATADNNTDHSMHLTLSVDRSQFTWGKFLREMAETATEEFSAEISSVVATSKPLHTQIPVTTLRKIAKSLDNGDLLPTMLMEMHEKLRSLVKSEFPPRSKARSVLHHYLTTMPPKVFDETVDLLRHKMVMGRNKPYIERNCTSLGSDLSVNDWNNLWFRRARNSRLMLIEIPAGVLLVLGSGGDKDEHLFESKLQSGIRYALGSFGGSKGYYFALETMSKESGLSEAESRQLIKKLVGICLLETSKKDPPPVSKQ